MKAEKRLKDWAEEYRERFETHYDGYGCSCFQSAPCGWCTHEGNPLNQAEDEDCWEFVDPIDGLIQEVKLRLRDELTYDWIMHRCSLGIAFGHLRAKYCTDVYLNRSFSDKRIGFSYCEKL